MKEDHRSKNKNSALSASVISLAPKTLPEQELVLQLSASRLSPSQHAPPLDGGGLVQFLLRVIMPPPHVALHSLQSDERETILI